MKVRDVIDLVILAALWGASFLLMRISVPEFGAIPMMTVRIGLASMFLLPLLYWKSQQKMMLKHLMPISLVGIFNSALPFSLLAFSTIYLTAGFTSILNATTPMFAAIIAFFWMKQRLTLSPIIGLAIGFLGVIILVQGKTGINFSTNGIAVITALAGAACYGIAANYTKKYLVGISALAITCGSLLSAFLLMLPFAIYWWPQTTPSIESWINVIVLALVCTGFAQILYFRLIERVGAANATTVTFLMPVFGLFWGYWFLNEIVEMNTLLACAVILLGTGLTIGVIQLPKKLIMKDKAR